MAKRQIVYEGLRSRVGNIGMEADDFSTEGAEDELIDEPQRPQSTDTGLEQRISDELNQRLTRLESTLRGADENIARRIKEAIAQRDAAPPPQHRAPTDIEADLAKALDEGDSRRAAALQKELNAALIAESMPRPPEAPAVSDDPTEQARQRWLNEQPWWDPDHPRHEEVRKHAAAKDRFLRSKGLSGEDLMREVELSCRKRFGDDVVGISYSDPDEEIATQSKPEQNASTGRKRKARVETHDYADVGGLPLAVDPKDEDTLRVLRHLGPERVASVAQTMRQLRHNPRDPQLVKEWLRTSGIASKAGVTL
jgi:hypothetical protein